VEKEISSFRKKILIVSGLEGMKLREKAKAIKQFHLIVQNDILARK
jgi:hypothetical protein